MRRIALTIALLCSATVTADELTARDLVEKAMDHWRGVTSYGVSTMIIHRPDWERSMTIESWSKGDKTTLVRVIEPKKDAGNGTLLRDNQMWTYTPRINRIIKVPSSMMSQAWMGSDFSNKDISKDTAILDEYDHSLLKLYQEDGHQVYVVQSVPHEEAAVVWGREVLHIRDDWVMLQHQFWDQDDVLVKTLRTLQIEEMDGRTIASVIRMGKEESPQEWTEVRTNVVDFDIDLPANLFTLSNLRNPRE